MSTSRSRTSTTALEHPRPDGDAGRRADRAHAIAAGKVMLAELRPGRLAEVLTRSGLPRLASRTVADRRALDRELMRVRSDGAAVEVEEYQARWPGWPRRSAAPTARSSGRSGSACPATEFAARRWELERLVRSAATRAAAVYAAEAAPRLGTR